jgi:hypothetical protein
VRDGHDPREASLALAWRAARLLPLSCAVVPTLSVARDAQAVITCGACSVQLLCILRMARPARQRSGNLSYVILLSWMDVHS